MICHWMADGAQQPFVARPRTCCICCCCCCWCCRRSCSIWSCCCRLMAAAGSSPSRVLRSGVSLSLRRVSCTCMNSEMSQWRLDTCSIRLQCETGSPANRLAGTCRLVYAVHLHDALRLVSLLQPLAVADGLHAVGRQLRLHRIQRVLCLHQHHSSRLLKALHFSISGTTAKLPPGGTSMRSRGLPTAMLCHSETAQTILNSLQVISEVRCAIGKSATLE